MCSTTLPETGFSPASLKGGRLVLKAVGSSSLPVLCQRRVPAPFCSTKTLLDSLTCCRFWGLGVLEGLEDLAVSNFWIGAVKVLPALSSLSRIKEERDSAPQSLFHRHRLSLSYLHFRFVLLAARVLRGAGETVP